MKYDHRKMGKIIVRLRNERNWTQEVLSGLAGIGRPHLAMIESGKKNPAVSTLWAIAQALDVPLSDMFRMVEAEEAPEEKPLE